MIKDPLPIFERLSLLELHLGLYDAVYRSLLDGSRLIAVDLSQPLITRRVGMARELYVAFCRSRRAFELGWPDDVPYMWGKLFARCLLMPAAWVRQIYPLTHSLEELAAHFGVPLKTADQRLRELGLDSPEQRSVA